MKHLLILFAVFAVLAMTGVNHSSAQVADVCETAQPNEIPRGYGVLVPCIWADQGPARNLRWGSNESRGNIRKALYRDGVLFQGCVDVVIGLREMNLTKGVPVELFVNGNSVMIDPKDNGRHAVRIQVCGGRATLAIPWSIMTNTWWIQFDTFFGYRLLYTNPNHDGGFTKKVGMWKRSGYSELGDGFVRLGWSRTRLNTVAR